MRDETIAGRVESLRLRQLESWTEVRTRYENLSGVQTKSFECGGATIRVQYNPSRIVSSSAKVDARSLAERPCFLCRANRPAEQELLAWGNGRYDIAVNPFPIFSRHLTVSSCGHEPQRIAGRIGDMAALAKDLPDYTIFYNGPACGASAPDHMHFQAGCRGGMPFEAGWRDAPVCDVSEYDGCRISRINAGFRTAYVVEADDAALLTAAFGSLYDTLPLLPGEAEPMMNLLCWYEPQGWILALFPRRRHRPSCYTATGDEHLLISPASVDMGGLLVVPRAEDFEKIEPTRIARIFREVCF